MSAVEGLRIRGMNLVDLSRVMEIANGLPEAPHWSRATWESVLEPAATPRRIALVADDAPSGIARGFAVAALLPPEAELESIAVARERQRHGLGRRLWAELETGLRSSGVHEVHLEVRASNAAARAFYASLGFRETGRRRGYYADPDEDAVLLRLGLG